MADDRTTAYAEALFAVARAEGPLAEVEDELFRVAQVVKGNDLNYPADWRLSKKGRESNEG